MNRLFRWMILVSFLVGCILSVSSQILHSAAAMPNSTTELPVRLAVAQETDFGRHFQELGVDGSVLIYDLNNDRVYQHNPQRNATAFLPGSTFKVLNALISLETGVIPDEITVFTWDGIQRQVPEWNRDLNLKEAMALSAIWFYQVLARRIGHERMQNWVSRVGYGNQKIGKKEEIDSFWLQGELRITPQEQIQFLRRLYKNDLPFSERSLSIVKNMMIVEQTPDYTIRGKTGWVGFADAVRPQIGWFVGYLEKGKNVYFFATNIEIRNKKDSSARAELTRRCFKGLGVL
ncbi:class D beta-lactamase [Leptolyngbya sp. FACHB-36]|uniref:class D beta-lactamase n=1 Tax=Leptolyngbya sp. FACHB-36 TaxID=2692808 RepID=UPI0016810273|nr:class D beta-lactamase [Leptolyngbya sp. FACHB-36]